jgi:hypothetical protein
MIRIRFRQTVITLAILAGVVMTLSLPLPRLGAAQQDHQNQTDQESQQDQQKQNQNQTDKKTKKKSSIFGNDNDVNAQSSDQKKLTASAGTKGALDGKQIADLTPTPADRQQVTDMEKYAIPQGDLKKFQDDGHLQPK